MPYDARMTPIWWSNRVWIISEESLSDTRSTSDSGQNHGWMRLKECLNDVWRMRFRPSLFPQILIGWAWLSQSIKPFSLLKLNLFITLLFFGSSFSHLSREQKRNHFHIFLNSLKILLSPFYQWKNQKKKEKKINSDVTKRGDIVEDEYLSVKILERYLTYYSSTHAMVIHIILNGYWNTKWTVVRLTLQNYSSIYYQSYPTVDGHQVFP